MWISQLITFNTTINHWKTLLDRDHERMMELRGKNEIKKRLACYFLHPKFTRKENLLSTWQCWTTCTQWTVSSGMKFVCDWSIILSRNLSHVSVSGSLLCDQILFLLKEWIIDDKLRSHHFQEMNQLSMNNRSAKPLSLINILRPPCFRETRFWDNNYPGRGFLVTSGAACRGEIEPQAQKMRFYDAKTAIFKGKWSTKADERSPDGQGV